jgi:hypothetical protein
MKHDIEYQQKQWFEDKVIMKEVFTFIDICEKRNELDFLYSITKICSSIGEGFGYYSNYSRKNFDASIRSSENFEYRSDYLYEEAIYIYKLYLEQIGVL